MREVINRLWPFWGDRYSRINRLAEKRGGLSACPFASDAMRVPPHPMGVFSTRSQIPHGQAPAQNPHPMQRSALTTYSNTTPSPALRLMAASGHVATQMPQSRHVPHDEHWEPHWSMSSYWIIRGSRYSSEIRSISITCPGVTRYCFPPVSMTA